VNDRPSQKAWEDIPFGAMEVPPGYSPPAPPASPNPSSRRSEASESDSAQPKGRNVSAPERALPATDEAASNGAASNAAALGEPADPRDWRKPENRRGRGRRGGRRRRHPDEGAPHADHDGSEGSDSAHPDRVSSDRVSSERDPKDRGDEGGRTNGSPVQTGFRFEGDEAPRRGGPAGDASDDGDERETWEAPASAQGQHGQGQGAPGQGPGGRRRRRRGRRGRSQGPFSPGAAGGEQGEGAVATAAPPHPGHAGHHGGPRPKDRGQHGQHGQQRPQPERQAPQVLTGMLVLEKGGWGVLRREEAQFLASKDDIWVPQHLIQRFKLRDGSLITGPCGRGQQHRYQINAIDQVDGKDPREVMNLTPFKKLVSIDPDFHYAAGDVHGDASMRVVDLIAPVGRGSRGLIVAPPRSGKTILMRKFANAITDGYPDVHLMVLLVDERPEEATEWKRTTKGQVFVSTNDEDTKNHVEIAEAVFLRCQRLVELGQDVVLLLDSITRLARAFNNYLGTSGKTMSGGLDSRAMERPRAFFGMARNTETAGSLTILGTTLVETGSRLDQMVFEEFKGTGNLEIVLSRKLADRRIFPAIDIERSGTRKEEKLLSAQRLKRTHVLRRVLLKMNFIEAMELLSTKLEDVDKTDDFLKRFDVDPEA
jgi:transcription termination factor Rho